MHAVDCFACFVGLKTSEKYHIDTDDEFVTFAIVANQY